MCVAAEEEEGGGHWQVGPGAKRKKKKDTDSEVGLAAVEKRVGPGKRNRPSSWRGGLLCIFNKQRAAEKNRKRKMKRKTENHIKI